MKNLKFLLLLFVAINVNARKQNPIRCIHTYSQGISIDKVVTKNRQTTIHFRWLANNGDAILIPSDCWLVGADKSLHPLLSHNGYTPGVQRSPKDGYKKKFTMTFAALADTDSVFDIVSGHDFLKYFCFFGVHKANVMPFIKEYKVKHLTPILQNSLKGDVVIRGNVERSNKDMEKLTVYYRSADPNVDSNLGSQAQIDSLGNFYVKICTDSPQWSYIHFDDCHIPVVFHPCDTVSLKISNIGKYNQEVEYRSENGNEVFERLMQADPNGPWLEYLISNTETSPDYYTKEINKVRTEVSNLYGYLAGKYNLSDEEHHLLHLNFVERLRLLDIVLKVRSIKGVNCIDENEPIDPCRLICPNSNMLEQFIRIDHIDM